MHIVQLLPNITYGDAISNDARAIQKILRRWDPDTAIYAEDIAPLAKGDAQKAECMPQLAPQDVVIYHGSTGTPLNDKLPQMGGRKVMIYHNITPPAFFGPYSPPTADSAQRGLDGIKRLADHVDYCIAVSEFNRQDLLRMGYTCPIDVCPVLIPFSDYETPPDAALLKQYEGDGIKTLLFVGRVVPNKKQEDIIRAFYFYHKYYEPKSRLILVGSWVGMDAYHERLCAYVGRLGLQGSVFLAGHLMFDAILAWYRLADAFVCMSEHEGFCVPLVEAMYFDVPVFAYNSTAIPDTLGGSGVLLPEKDPAVAAACIDKVLRDPALRKSILAGQRRRLADFSYDKVGARMEALLGAFLGESPL